MATPPISNSLIKRTEALITDGTTALSSIASKWFAKKEVREEVAVDSARFQRRRNSIIQNYSVEDMRKNVEQFQNEIDTTRFKLALEKFEKAQEDLNAAESEESLSARRIKMSGAHEELKREFKQFNIDGIKEKRLSAAREKSLRQNMVQKALKVKEAVSESEMLHLEQAMETDPELADVLLNARLVLIKNSSSPRAC